MENENDCLRSVLYFEQLILHLNYEMGEVKKDEVVDRFETYEDYLNMFITEDDMLYLGEEEIARNDIYYHRIS